MRIVIDLPGGIALPTDNNLHVATARSLLQRLLPLAAEHELILAICDPYADIEATRHAVDGLPLSVRVCHLPALAPIPANANADHGVHFDANANSDLLILAEGHKTSWRSLAQAAIREHFLAQLEPDLVFVPLAFAHPALPVTISAQSMAFHTVLQWPAEPAANANTRTDTCPDSGSIAGTGSIAGVASGTGADSRTTSATGTLPRWQAQLQQAASLCISAHDDPVPHLAPMRPRMAVLPTRPTATTRPRLAYISPLPPERSGIADYSAELLPQLARYYDVEIVIEQAHFDPASIEGSYPLRSSNWFRQHAHEFTRVLYHVGNSPMHKHMFALFQECPGILVLHDFYLGNVMQHLDESREIPGLLARSLYQSHGWQALLDQQQSGMSATLWKYPCNKPLVENATGVISHSRHSRQLAMQWYGPQAGEHWRTLPLMRGKQAEFARRNDARARFDLLPNQFIVCAFGMLGPTKLNERLLQAWQDSGLMHDQHCQLVFVGENDPGPYGRELAHRVELLGNVRITGFVSSKDYQYWLLGADCAVQLRTSSRGETSAAVLDCLLHGLPTIVNAHGANAELPEGTALMLSDECPTAELISALQQVQQDAALRQRLRTQALAHMASAHAPQPVAEQYFQAIEYFAEYGRNQDYRRLLHALDTLSTTAAPQAGDGRDCALAIGQNLALQIEQQCLIDISAVVQSDIKTGIQRVVRSILMALIQKSPPGFRVEPVFTRGEGQPYHYARSWMAKQLDLKDFDLIDHPVELQSGDVFIGLDLIMTYTRQNHDRLQAMRARGVKVVFVVYDILPLLRPEVFPPEAEPAFHAWIDTIGHVSDGLLCISRAVANEVHDWLLTHPVPRQRPLRIGYFHLGADIDASAPSKGMPDDAPQTLAALRARPSILMVGTVEPRKGHAQALAAFDLLWQQGVDANLVIVGKHGWMVDALAERLKSHGERGQRLFWLAGISDEMLLEVYQASNALLAASEGEGFGLPLIEAAQHQMPIIARKLPVFQEIAGAHAFWFDGLQAQDLASALKTWIELFHAGKAPDSRNMPWLTWEQSAEELKQVIWGDDWLLHYPDLTANGGNANSPPAADAQTTDDSSMADADTATSGDSGIADASCATGNTDHSASIAV